MKIFGTICYGHVNEYKQKLDPRSREGIFVGYDKNSAAYLVYYPKDRRIRRHGMVTFTGLYPKELKNMTANNSAADENNNIPGDIYNAPDVNKYVPAISNDNSYVPAISNSNSYVPAINNDKSYVPDTHKNNYVPEVNSHNDNETSDSDDEQSINNNNTGRPKRLRKKPEYLKDYLNLRADDNVVDFCYMYKAAPKTYNQAVRSPEADMWKDAMDEEMQSLRENQTFELVELPEGKTTVGGRWVYAVKEAPNDGGDLYKARFVAKGFSQTEGIDYFSTFAPTARLSTIRLVIQIAVNCDYIIHQMDVKSAYLNAPIDCELYMEQPKGYQTTSQNGKKLVYRLRKSLYGLKQSAHNWREVMCQFFTDHGCSQSKTDPCLFMKCNKSGEKLIYVIWVDDIIIIANSESTLSFGKNILKNRFKMKDLGEISKFLGIRFKRYQDGSMSMDQTQYLQTVLEKFGMETCNPRSTPCEIKPSAYENDDDDEIIDEPEYRAIVGCMIYAMTCTRPDLSWAVTRLSQRLSRPGSGDWVLLKQVLRYIKGTIEHRLHFTKSELKLVCYSDADWASSVEDRRSTTGYYFSLSSHGPAISWKSRKQPTVALSTCEAEYMALCESAQEAVYLKQVLDDFAEVLPGPVEIFGDNQGALATVKNPIKHSRMKHVDIRYHFIRDLHTNNEITLSYVASDSNVADIMTKPLPKVKYEKFREALFGRW